MFVVLYGPDEVGDRAVVDMICEEALQDRELMGAGGEVVELYREETEVFGIVDIEVGSVWLYSQGHQSTISMSRFT